MLHTVCGLLCQAIFPFGHQILSRWSNGELEQCRRQKYQDSLRPITPKLNKGG